jgi:peptidoglycan/LPS O-acetylase OafA/YrhL
MTVESPSSSEDTLVIKLPDALPPNLRDGLALGRLPAFDSVRGIASFMIILTHMHLIPGHVALILFFVMSGFLITWLLEQEEAKHERISVSAFFVRRVLRIFPAHYATLFVVVYLIPPMITPVPTDFTIWTGLYLSNYYQAIHGGGHYIISHFWSLSVEEQFYLAWPFVFILAGKRRVAVLVFLIAFAWVNRAVQLFVFDDMHWAYYAIDTRMDHILIRRGSLPNLWRVICAKPRYTWWPFAMLLALSLASALFGRTFRIGVAFYLQPILIALLFVQLIAFHNARYMGWMSWKPLTYVGEISYATYLVHLMVIDQVRHRLPDESVWIHIFLVISLSLLYAALSRILLERPFMRLKRTWVRTH